MKWPKPIGYIHPNVRAYAGKPLILHTDPKYLSNPVELFTKEQVKEMLKVAVMEGFKLGRIE